MENNNLTFELDATGMPKRVIQAFQTFLLNTKYIVLIAEDGSTKTLVCENNNNNFQLTKEINLMNGKTRSYF